MGAVNSAVLHWKPRLLWVVQLQVLPELMIWLCIPQGFAGEVPAAPWVWVLQHLYGLSINSQWFQVLHLHQYLWRESKRLLRRHWASLCCLPDSCSSPSHHYCRGTERVLTSNNIHRLVGWATIQDAPFPLGLILSRAWQWLLHGGLLIQLMEPVDNVSSNNSFPCT